MDIVSTTPRPGQKKVIILGGGFAGLEAAKTLAHHNDFHVRLIDQKNHHLFQPLLYQVATAGLNPSDIAIPIRSILSNAKNVAVHMGKITKVNLAEKWVSGDGGLRLAYDYLIVACGAQHSYFGKNEWEEFAPGLKTVEQATEIRRRILVAFEAAENEVDPAKQEALLTFVVVGGGPTGVEMAGSIAEISRSVIVRDFRRIDPSKARVLLVEAGPRILNMFDEGLAAHAREDLKKMGVEVLTSGRVTNIDAEGVTVGSEKVAARTVVWAAGVQASPIGKALGVELDKAGRIPVAPDLSLPGYPEVFAVGDIAHVDIGEGKLLPGLAPAAIQTGIRAAKNILASAKGEARKPFKYLDKGQMATIGKRRAIAQAGKMKMTGLLAWLAWMFIHILYLVGFKNRLSVLGEWVWAYVFSKRGARLITSKDWYSYRTQAQDLPPAQPTTSPEAKKPEHAAS
ncbi:MAG: NAD(P)/FAD-dependent oxidoreductase [Proteobacteria bacterium]|nr:MAG: NAD(P)/FAD-dependent oxidoreductase [Pseudomonadota bacterium]